jgi:dephospho-CoA kinase
LKRIGITGGIGSGKSYIAKIIEQMGFPIYNSDLRSKELTLSNDVIREGLISLFGEDVYINSELNKKLIASKIFTDDILREKVNKLIHPIVREDFYEWSLRQESRIVFNEAAILFETGAYRNLDATILVCAPLELKIKRVTERENCSRESVTIRMDKQWSDEKKVQLSDYVIVNDEQSPILNQIEKVVEKIDQTSI